MYSTRYSAKNDCVTQLLALSQPICTISDHHCLNFRTKIRCLSVRFGLLHGHTILTSFDYIMVIKQWFIYWVSCCRSSFPSVSFSIRKSSCNSARNQSNIYRFTASGGTQYF